MTRTSRLQAAPHWISQYPGKNILRGYRRHFGVDFECAIKELTMLGITLDAQYLSQVCRSEQARIRHRQLRHQAALDRTSDWCGEYFGIMDAPNGDSDGWEDFFLLDWD